MGEMSRQVFFSVPVEKVWKVWADIEKTPEWVEGVTESRITSAIREGRGMEWREKCLIGGQAVDMEHEVREWETGRKTVYQTTLPMGASMQTAAEFKSSGSGTEVNIEISWSLGMIGMFISEDKFLEMMEKAFSKTSEKWKQRAEA